MMKKIDLFKLAVCILFAILMSSATAVAKDIVLKMPSALPTKLPIVNNLEWFANQVEVISNGSIKFKIYQPGELVPPFEIQEAVSAGQVNAGWSSSLYLSGKMPAASLFGSVPFGPSASGYFGWFYFGNGQKLMQEMYDANGYNVKVFPMFFLPIETGGWFRKEIKSVADFKGMRLRWPGLGGKVLSKLGASISTIPGGEIFPSLEKGVIEGTEFSSPILDNVLGFWKIAKYNYFPGWHQTATAMELTINKKTWEKMSPDQQALIETAVMAASLRSMGDVDAHSGKIIKENMEKREVHTLVYPPDVMAALNKAWLEVAAEESEKDPFFKKVYEDFNGYMDDFKAWECNSYRLMPMGCGQ